MVKTASDQPRITVWSFSMTTERPRRRSESLASMPVAITPISALTMNSPAIVSASMVRMNRQLPPPSPATVPGSRAWNRLLSSSCQKSVRLLPARSNTETITAKTTISASVARASQATRAGVPLDIELSNR